MEINKNNTRNMRTCLIRAMIAAVGMVLCAVAAVLIPPLWEGVSGRDFRPQAAMMGILIFVFAVTLRRWRRWRIWDFVWGLAIIQVVTLLIIVHFTGFRGLDIFDRFNLLWLANMNVFIAGPWILGFMTGSFLLTSSNRRAGISS